MMKKITKFLLLCSAVCSFTVLSASAQSFTISNVEDPSFKDGQYHAQLSVVNTASAEKNVKVKAYLDEIKMSDESYFCVGVNCYPPSVTEVTYTLGASESGLFIAYLTPGPSQGTRTVRYEFSDVDNPSDKVEHTFIFGATSVNDDSYGVIASLSAAFPSPSVESATIHYSVPETAQASIEVMTADGGLLKTFSLQDPKGSVVIPTAEFASGSYFYTLVINGKIVASNKLVIAR